MLKKLKQTAERTLTENGAATYSTSRSGCLDLFSTIGALRGAPDRVIEDRFLNAWMENPDLALKIAFYARDVRGGLGERHAFRVMLQVLAQLAPATVKKHMGNIPEYGRYDDLMTLLDTPCGKNMVAYVKGQLEADLIALEAGEGNVSLLAKWLPSVNASNLETVSRAKALSRALHMSEAKYRRTLSTLRRRIAILENPLRERDYTFDYETQPSQAMLKYRKAFLRNDGEHYQAYLREVQADRATMHTGTLYPYEVIRPIFNRNIEKRERRALDTTWKALPAYTHGENALVVVDGSGSMYAGCYNPTPAAVALSLGVYFAQRNRGAFHNHFITFSENPQLVEIQGNDIVSQVSYCMRYNECANTNLQAVFDLLLNTAAMHGLKQRELPSTLYIISDMEFDACAENASLTNFQAAKRKFASLGYRLPQVVFWNVASRKLQQPVRKNEQGVVLVSGCSASIFDMVASNTLSPYQYMLKVLSSPRYRDLTA